MNVELYNKLNAKKGAEDFTQEVMQNRSDTHDMKYTQKFIIDNKTYITTEKKLGGNLHASWYECEAINKDDQQDKFMVRFFKGSVFKIDDIGGFEALTKIEQFMSI